MDVCLTVVEKMPVVDMPLPAISINELNQVHDFVWS